MNIEEFREKAKNEEYAPGWEAIDKAFDKYYLGQEPNHYATKSRAICGGTEYLDGYSIYQSPNGHKHILTYGMSELYANEEAFGGEYSRWGYEMTFKLNADTDEECMWAISFLGNLARYTYTQERWFEPLHFFSNNNEPIKLNSNSKITACIVVEDTEIPGVDTIYGRLDFLQFVGITNEEFEMIKEDHSKIKRLIEEMKKDNPFLVTDLNRTKSYVF